MSTARHSEADAAPAAGEWTGGLSLPANFRKLTLDERRKALRAAILERSATGRSSERAHVDPDEAALGGEMLDLSELMIESSIGYLPVPLGVATGFLIDGREAAVPMAVEEPSVVAAATFAAHLVADAGGFTTWGGEPTMTAQVFIEKARPNAEQLIIARSGEIEATLAPLLESMTARGGGFRGISVERIPPLDLLRVDIAIDVRDSMGANLLNSAAEESKALLAGISGGTPVMSILTNEARERLAGARCSIPVARLRRAGMEGAEIARRIALASEIAQVDPSRAVTHNKGVMNGISALALATGNDTRAIESAVHRYASADGSYRGVTRFSVHDLTLYGELEAPLPFATVGGSVGFHPATSFCLELLGNPDSSHLARIAAAVGLAQNFAALFALMTDGIQKGHMELHRRKGGSR